MNESHNNNDALVAADADAGSRLEPRVIRALAAVTSSGHPQRWYLIGREGASCWISSNQMIEAEKEVYKRLDGCGFPVLAARTKNRIKELIEKHVSFEPGLVAGRPGWLEEFFVLGDGTVIAPPGRRSDEVIVAFPRIPKFHPRGDLQSYKTAIGPVISGQPLPLFAIYLALLGPVLKFVPGNITTNPMVEFVGPPERGKSVLACLAASVWAGSERDVGGAETWDTTLNSLDNVRQDHNDIILVMDESNQAGENRQQQAALLGKAIFKLATSGSKRRHNEVEPDPVRLAVLSTSNEPLRDIVKGAPDVVHALSTRLATVMVGEQGVLHKVPSGFDDSKSATENLRDALNVNYGVLGQAFVENLVREAAEDESILKATIAADVEEFRDLVWEPGESERISKLFGMAYAVAKMASRYQLVPVAPDRARSMLRHIYKEMVARPLSALDKIEAYVEQNLDDIPLIAKTRVLTKEVFGSATGFRRSVGGVREVLIPTTRFHSEFPDYNALLKELVAAGRLKVENGRQRKLSIKAPKSLCATGRVYVIRLGAKA